MLGEELYDLYVIASNEGGVGVDDWADIDEGERATWNRLAPMVADFLRVEGGDE